MTKLLAAATIAFACISQTAYAQLTYELVASGLTTPVAFVQDPSQPGVQVIVQQDGPIRVMQDGVLLDHYFLDLSLEVTFGGEQGLLGLAFAPDYATSGRFYVNFTNLDGHTVVARFLRDSTDPLRADPSSRFDLIWPDGAPFIEQPFPNHNGGNLVFGPDGYLYIGLGDGGSANDPGHRAQHPRVLLGKMLRIDVCVPDGHPTGYEVPPTNPFVGSTDVLGEIWAFGLRNPWRYSFDDPARGGTGALVIADVGQNLWEEINYEPAGQGGRNYGWRNREGANDHVTSLPPYFEPLTDPIYQYPHIGGGGAITGGFVYRGNALGSNYFGRYFYADIVFSRLWSIGYIVDPETGEANVFDEIEHTAELGPAAQFVSSFGVDANGELYVLSYVAGNIYRLVPDPSQPPPPPPPSTCETPQPGPDWICVNGGWYPPGYPLPGQPPPSACPTVQPGPDWVCVDGNWYPPWMTLPGNPDVLAGVAVVRFRPEEGGFWAIEFDSGRAVVPLNGLSEEFRVDGLRVNVTAKVRRDIASFYGTVAEISAISVISE